MLALQAPPRNLFSRRIPRTLAPRNIVDYLDARRGVKPTWGESGDRSPQWRASRELAKAGFFERLKSQLLSLTTTRCTRLAGIAPLSWIVGRYVGDVAMLDDQVDAFNRMFAVIADSQTRVSGTIDSLPSYDATADGRLYVVDDGRARAAAQAERSRARFARDLFTPTGAGEVLGPSIIGAEFLAHDRGSILDACQADIARRCEAAATYLWESLMRGLGGGLLGLVSWHSEDLCWYVRGEHHLKPKGDRARNSYEHWEVCKEVHLMDAMHLAGIPGWLDLPRPVQNVVDAIPPLLHPELGTVVGTMVKEREISWLAGEVSYPGERVLPQRRLVFDPAVVVGPVVLTGWELPEHSRPGWWMQLDCALAK
jgi:hypothetical protein